MKRARHGDRLLQWIAACALLLVLLCGFALWYAEYRPPRWRYSNHIANAERVRAFVEQSRATTGHLPEEELVRGLVLTGGWYQPQADATYTLVYSTDLDIGMITFDSRSWKWSFEQ